MPLYQPPEPPEFTKHMEPRDAWAMALYYAEGCADAEWETDTVEYARLDGPFELDMEIKEAALRPATERLTPEDRRYLQETTAGCIIQFEKTNGSVWVLWYDSSEELEAAWDRILRQPAAEPDESGPPF